MSKIKFDWLTKDSKKIIENGYLANSPSIEHRYQTIADTIQRISDKNNKEFGADLESINKKYNYTTDGIGERFERYISNNWISFASPVLSNFGGKKGLPISCNFGVVSDTLDSITSGIHEVSMLAKNGAGTAKNFSAITPKGAPIGNGGFSEGVMSWIELYAHTMDKVTQGSVRRGFLTAYLDIRHEEIEDFLLIGTIEMEEHNKHLQTITTAVTIDDEWMKEMIAGDKTKRKIWSRILRTRNDIGFPYILFTDNCNKNSPQVYKDKGVTISNSNICAEAIEYADEEKEFACCLSSVNVYHYDDWKDDRTFIMDVNIMLDNVISEYVIKGSNMAGLKRAVKFANEHRAIGVGTLGLHSYMQRKSVVWGSLQSYGLNNSIFSTLRKYGDESSKYMAEAWGEPKYMEGTGFRNSSRMAQAPTKTSSAIMGGYSEGIQPILSNNNLTSLAKVNFEYKNPELIKLLESKGKNTKEIWRDIMLNNGSVQTLDCLTDHEKEVFKTFSEVSQMDIIKLASQRQKHIDMGQSINLMFHEKTPPKMINKLFLEAWKLEVKTLYYQNSISSAQAFRKELMTCSSCEG